MFYLTDDEVFINSLLSPSLGINTPVEYISTSYDSFRRVFYLFKYAEHFKINDLEKAKFKELEWIRKKKAEGLK